MTDIIVGLGEVGVALWSVLGERRTIVPCDPAVGYPLESLSTSVGWMHIAIPYTDTFTTIVADDIHKFNPDNTVIHSTVPVGTTRKVEKDADYQTTVYYSPVRGRHPNLTRYLRQFPKWYATEAPGEYDNRITAYFAEAGIQTRKAPNFEVLEWMKLLETFTFGYNLVMWQEIERQCKKLPGHSAANLSVLKSWLYEKKKVYDGDLGYVPIYDLVPGPIGGHCIMPNLDLLEPLMDTYLYDWMVKSNEMRK